MDYYNILEIGRDADPKQIKNAYRKLASKHHPDKGGDESKFKEIQKAYETLSNPERKQMYDQFGTDDPQQTQWQRYDGPDFGRESPFFNFEEIFGGFRQRGQRNPDGISEVHIGLLDAYNGTDVVVDLGYTREIIKIEPGTINGSRLRLRGKGPSRIKGAPPGDLIINIIVDMPRDVAVDGHDVYQRLTINAIDAMTGVELPFRHFTNTVLSVKIPAGIQPGGKLRLSGQGMPILRSGGKGNLYIIVDVTIPKIQSTHNKELLNKIKEQEVNE